MVEEDIVGQVEEVLSKPEEFDVFAYIDEQPVGQREVTIATNGAAVVELNDLLDQRTAILEERKEAAKRMGDVSQLSIADEDEDTEFDDRINELVKTIEETALIFELQSIAPKLTKSIRQNYTAKKSALETDEEKEQLDEKMEADILRRTIKAVRTGDGSKRSTNEWTIEDILELDTRFHPEQSAKLITEMYNITYMGDIFDRALTPDFS